MARLLVILQMAAVALLFCAPIILVLYFSANRRSSIRFFMLGSACFCIAIISEGLVSAYASTMLSFYLPPIGSIYENLRLFLWPSVFEEIGKFVLIFLVRKRIRSLADVLILGIGYGFAELAIILGPPVLNILQSNNIQILVNDSGVAAQLWLSVFERTYVYAAQVAFMFFASVAVLANKTPYFLIDLCAHALLDCTALFFGIGFFASLVSAELFGACVSIVIVIGGVALVKRRSADLPHFDGCQHRGTSAGA